MTDDIPLVENAQIRKPCLMTGRFRQPFCLRTDFPPRLTPLSETEKAKPQAVKKVEVQEALPPAGVLGAEPLSLVPQHFSREPAQRCSRALAVNHGFFDRLR